MRDLALKIETGQIVVALLRDVETVADEHQGCLDLGRQRKARAEERLFSEGEPLGVAAANQRQARARLSYFLRSQLDALVIAVNAGRLDAERLQLLDDVGLRLPLAGAAGVAALEPVIGEHLDRAPPRLAVEIWSRGYRARQQNACQRREIPNHQVSSL